MNMSDHGADQSIQRILKKWRSFVETVGENPRLSIEFTPAQAATGESLQKLEADAGRPLPHAYRAFMEIAGGLTANARMLSEDWPLSISAEFYSPDQIASAEKEPDGFLPVYRWFQDLIEPGEYQEESIYGFMRGVDGIHLLTPAGTAELIEDRDFIVQLKLAFRKFREGIGELEFEIKDRMGYVRSTEKWLQSLAAAFELDSVNNDSVAAARRMGADAVNGLRLKILEDREANVMLLGQFPSLENLRIDIQHDYKTRNPSPALIDLEPGEMQSVRKLHVDCASEVDLEFLRAFPNLEELELGISRVDPPEDFSFLQELRILKFGRASVISADDAILNREPAVLRLPANLRELQLHGLQLTKLPRLEGPERLDSVFIDDCEFGELDLTPLAEIEIEDLIIRDSEITSLRYEPDQIQALGSLDLHYNPLPESEKKKLRELLPEEGRLYLDDE